MAPFMLGQGITHLALLGNFLPRKCGLATYTTDTFNALAQRYPDLQVDVYAMDDHPGLYDYPDAVTRAIPQAASMPISREPIIVPARSTTSPRAMSDPALETN